jgi:hypothetical protein
VFGWLLVAAGALWLFTRGRMSGTLPNPSGGTSVRGEVTSFRTPFAGEPYSLERRRDFYDQVGAAYRAIGVPDAVLPLLVAHSGLATGWGRNVWNHNVGVIRAGRDSGDWISSGKGYVRLSTREVIDGETVRQEGQAWRAYGSLEESVADLLHLLHASRYSGARAQLAAADEGWFRTLGQEGFYTQPFESHSRTYLSALSRVRREWT